MQCPACGASSPKTSSFCRECGERLSRLCSRCAVELLPSARFCHQCGSPTPAGPDSAARSAPSPPLPAPLPDLTSGEIRLATVLFADMTASVEVTRNLHPEDALSLVKGLLRAMADAVLANGGKVDRFLGDGALGVFGISQAKESDAERAVLAALQIRDAAHQLGLEVRVGLNTGDVYAGGVGSEQYHETTVMGPVVNLASRLQMQAVPGEVLIGEATHRLVRRHFRCEPRRLEVKGLSEPLVAYSVERLPVQSERQPGMAEPQPVALTGREREMSLLRSALARAARGRGQLISIVGDPGLGKTRLLAELRWEAAGREAAPGGAPVLWLEGRCPEFSEAVPYWPFVDILRQWLGWSIQDDEASRRERLLERLEQLVHIKLLRPEVAEDLIGPIAALLSVPLETAGPREGESYRVPARHVTFAALRRFLLALAAARPLVLAVEDLHWADSLSLELISFITEAVPAAPMLIICTYRPDPKSYCRHLERVAARKCPEAYHPVRLSELGPEESCRLAASLLATDALPPQVEEFLLRMGQGNPLFIEETVRAMVDTGVIRRGPGGWEMHHSAESLGTTGTIQSVIHSRVDRLPADLKRLLQHAAVLGTVFHPRVLEQMGVEERRWRSGLAQLEDAGLVLRRRATRDEEFGFKHALTRETIYETILRRRRKELHQQAARAIEQLYADALDDFYEELARHYSLSDHYLKAAEYLIRSGERAQRLYANREAAAYLERALQTLENVTPEEAGEMQPRALELLGDVLFRVGSHQAAEQRFLHALNTVDPARQPLRFATLSWKIADAVHWQGDMARAVEIAETGLQALGGRHAAPEAVRLLEVVMRSHWAVDDLDSARRTGNALEAVLSEVPYFESLYMIYYALAWLEIKCRQYERARHWLDGMETVCRQHGDEIGLARCYHGLGDLYRAVEDYAEAAAWFARSVTHCERIGDAHLLMEGHIEWAQVLLLLGEPEHAAEPHIRRGMALAEEMASTGGMPSIQALCSALGRAFANRGNTERAIQFLEHAFDFGRHPAPEVTLRTLKELYARTGCPERLEALCRSLGYAPPGG